jgi:hypothetical protein
MNFDSYYQPPDPEPIRCVEHGVDECDLDTDECSEDDGCNICGVPFGCICDDLYESYRESLWED